MILEIFILILAIPTGYIIAWLASDELKVGRKWFVYLAISSFILGSICLVYSSADFFLTASFIFIVSLINFNKSKKI